MAFRLLSRLALHWLVITMIATTLVAPMQAADEALREAATAQTAATMPDMPCDDQIDMAASHEMPCNCCTPASCDLSVCLGTACLLELPRVAAAIPFHTIHATWNAPARPTRLIDTPLRPPIA
jgi:hypothetical protein